MFITREVNFYGTTYKVQVKRYDIPSEYGICGGRISKLLVWADGAELMSYDRGWDREPEEEETQLLLLYILQIFDK